MPYTYYIYNMYVDTFEKVSSHWQPWAALIAPPRHWKDLPRCHIVCSSSQWHPWRQMKFLGGLWISRNIQLVRNLILNWYLYTDNKKFDTVIGKKFDWSMKYLGNLSQIVICCAILMAFTASGYVFAACLHTFLPVEWAYKGKHSGSYEFLKMGQATAKMVSVMWSRKEATTGRSIGFTKNSLSAHRLPNIAMGNGP